MRSRLVLTSLTLLAVTAAPSFAQDHRDHGAATHHSVGPRFDSLPDGGRMVMRAPDGDNAAVAKIREHLAMVTRGMSAGDTAVANHIMLPGIATLTALGAQIRYMYTERPGGGEVRMASTSADGVRAIHSFIACAIAYHTIDHASHHTGGQRTHGAAGHPQRDHGDAHAMPGCGETAR